MRTYVDLTEGDRRAVQITLNNKTDGTAFVPSAAFVTIYDDTGTEVVPSAACYIDSNNVYTVIGTTVTSTPGKYKAHWIVKLGYTYNHSTIINVLDL